MKTYVYLVVCLSFFSFSPLLRAELPPVVDLLRAEKLQEINDLLNSQMSSKDFKTDLAWEAQAQTTPAELSWKTKTINGDYPKSGKFLPKETDILGDTQFILTKQVAEISILSAVSEQKAQEIQNKIEKILSFNSKRGDKINFKAKIAVPVVASAPEIQAETIAKVVPDTTAQLTAEETRLLAANEAVELGSVDLNEADKTSLPEVEESAANYFSMKSVALLAFFPLIFWIIKRNRPTPVKQRSEVVHSKTKAPMELIMQMELAEQLATEIDQEEVMLHYTGNFNVDLEYELNLQLDEVIMEAELALAEQEKLEGHDPLDLKAALAHADRHITRATFSFLDQLEEGQLTTLFTQETPFVRALILSQLTFERADQIYNNLKSQERFEVVWELGNLQLLTQEEQQDLAKELQVKASSTKEKGLKLVANTKTESLFMELPAKTLTLEGLAKLNRTILVEVAHQMNLEDLMVALTHAPKEVKERMVGALELNRRSEFLQLVQGLHATLEESVARQALLLSTAQAVMHDHDEENNLGLKQA